MSKRIHYGVQQVGFAKDGTTDFIAAHGVQSIGITTNFNLEQVYELGQTAIYENMEQIPDVEVTLEKVLDGYPLLYHLATQGSTSGTMLGRSNRKAVVALSVFDDSLDSATGTPLAEVHMEEMAVSSLSYTISAEGNSTESVTLVGNHKKWLDVEGGATAVFTGKFIGNNDTPNPTVQRREHVVFEPVTGSPTGVDANGQSEAWATILPTDIAGVSADGTITKNADGKYPVPIQSISVSADLGREEIFELGIKSPYDRFVSSTIEVRTDIEVLAVKYDGIDATEEGGNNGAPAGSNLRNQTIRVRLKDGTQIDTGKRNKLTSVTFSGGDAGGGNVTTNYSYVTFNELVVQHPEDPSELYEVPPPPGP